MKKIVIAVGIVVVLLAGYFGYETTLTRPVVNNATEVGYDSLKGTLNIVANDALIDFENSTVEVYEGDQLIDSMNVTENDFEYTFTNLDYDAIYEVRANISFKFKNYFIAKSEVKSNEVTTGFVEAWVCANEKDGNPTDGGMLELSTGNILYYTTYYNMGAFHGYIKVITKDGELVWDYENDFTKYTPINSVIERKNGDILVAGFSQEDRAAAYLMSFDEEGNLSNLSYAVDWFGYDDYHIFRGDNIIETENGEIKAIMTNGLNYYLVTINDGLYSATEKFLFSTPKIGMTSYSVSSDLYEYGDGFIITTQSPKDKLNKDIRILKINKNGDIISDNSYELDGRAVINDLVVENNKIYAVGETVYHNGHEKYEEVPVIEAFFLAVDDNDEQLSLEFVTDTKKDAYNELVMDYSGNFIVIGEYGNEKKTGTVISKLNREGKILFTTTMDEGRNQNILLTEEGIFVSIAQDKEGLIKKY